MQRRQSGVKAVTMAGKSESNQDAFSCKGDGRRFFAAVFDGAISRDASHWAKAFFETGESNGSATALVGEINRRLGSVSLGGGASTATIVELNAGADGWLDIAHVTDSWAMAQLHDGSTRLLTVDQHESFAENGIEDVFRQMTTEENAKKPTPKHPRWSLHDDKTLMEIVIQRDRSARP